MVNVLVQKIWWTLWWTEFGEHFGEESFVNVGHIGYLLYWYEVIIYSLDYKNYISWPEWRHNVTRCGQLVLWRRLTCYNVFWCVFRTARGAEINGSIIFYDLEQSDTLRFSRVTLRHVGEKESGGKRSYWSSNWSGSGLKNDYSGREWVLWDWIDCACYFFIRLRSFRASGRFNSLI